MAPSSQLGPSPAAAAADGGLPLGDRRTRSLRSFLSGGGSIARRGARRQRGAAAPKMARGRHLATGLRARRVLARRRRRPGSSPPRSPRRGRGSVAPPRPRLRRPPSRGRCRGGSDGLPRPRPRPRRPPRDRGSGMLPRPRSAVLLAPALSDPARGATRAPERSRGSYAEWFRKTVLTCIKTPPRLRICILN